MCVRLAEGEASEGLAWESVPLEMLYAAEPWRTFRWYMGQEHYSGSYWSSTQSDHVIYESRLELARLLYADFDRDVTAIAAQPFLLRAEVDGVLRRHIPDYLIATAAGPLVVDVKPRHRAAEPEHVFTFAWTREAAPGTTELRTMLRTFETDLTPALMSQLEEHAAEFLTRHGIRDEPLSWQPPTDIVRDLTFPGCDLRDIDPGMLHRLIRDDCLTTAQAARRLGVSHDAVRFVLQEQPAPYAAAKSAKRERGATVRRARAALPRNKFARFYLDEFRSLKWIAEHAGVNVDAIKILVCEYGMKRDGKATRWRQIDLDWLRDQRAVGRTCRELAEDTGFSPGMIGYLGRRHDMPGRRTRAEPPARS